MFGSMRTSDGPPISTRCSKVGNQVSENLAGDAKGKSTSGSNREAESSSASRFTAGALDAAAN
jgi:hypothetical protein